MQLYGAHGYVHRQGRFTHRDCSGRRLELRRQWVRPRDVTGAFGHTFVTNCVGWRVFQYVLREDAPVVSAGSQRYATLHAVYPLTLLEEGISRVGLMGREKDAVALRGVMLPLRAKNAIYSPIFSKSWMSDTNHEQ